MRVSDTQEREHARSLGLGHCLLDCLLDPWSILAGKTPSFRKCTIETIRQGSLSRGISIEAWDNDPRSFLRAIYDRL